MGDVDPEVTAIAARAISEGRAIPEAPGAWHPGRRDVQIRPNSFRREMATVNGETAEYAFADIVWTTGSIVRRYRFNFRSWEWEAYDQALSLDDSAVQLDRLNNGAPFLRVHRAADTEDVLGVTVEGSARIVTEGGKRLGVATIRFSRRDSIAPIVRDVQDQILRNISVGFEIFQNQITEREGDVPLHTAISWGPFETSVVPIGADDSAMFRSGAGGGLPLLVTPPSRQQNKEVTEMEIRVLPGFSLRVHADGGVEQVPADGSSGGVYEVRKKDDGTYEAVFLRALDTTPDQIRTAAAKEERERAAEIRLMGRTLRIEEGIVEEHVSRGISVEAARSRFHRIAADRDKGEGIKPNHGTTGVETSRRDLDEAEGMVLAIMHRANPGNDEIRKKFEANISAGGAAGRFAHMTLTQMAEYSLTSNGVNLVRGGVRMAPGAMSEAALYCDGDTRAKLMRVREERQAAFADLVERDPSLRGNYRNAAGGITTADLPGVFAEAVHRVLRRAYETAAPTYEKWAVRGTLRDFRSHNLIQVSDAPDLLEVGDAGEIERGGMRDSKESIQLREFARIIAITRRTLVNDDLNVFARLPQSFAAKARALENTIVYSVLTANAVMGDGIALFHTSHGNLGTITGGPAAAGALEQIRKLFRLQRSQSAEASETGGRLNLTPVYLIVPAALEGDADRILSDRLYAAVSANVVPENLRRLFQIVAEPDLDDASTSAYYCTIDPQQSPVDTVVYASLEGEQGLQVASRQGFEVLGLEIRVHETFAAKAADHRGMVKMPPVP